MTQKRFHICLSDTERTRVTRICEIKRPCVVLLVASSVVASTSTVSSPGSILGRTVVILLPLEMPFEEVDELKKSSSSTVPMITSGFEPIETICGLSNFILKFRLSPSRESMETSKLSYEAYAESSSPLRRSKAIY